MMKTIRQIDILLFVILSLQSVFFGHSLFAEQSKKVLIDAIHCNDYSEVGLQKENYEYHQISAFRHGFEYLQSRGVSCQWVKEGHLTESLLSKTNVLFINLVSGDRPPFLVSETKAIVDFVAQGGALFVITDHSNCYLHSHILEPLFTELDLESTKNTVCDRFGNTLASGNAWILVSRFEKHPITEGIHFLGMQTAGNVDARFAVAFSSEDSWPDRWECFPYLENMQPGFYGNFTQEPNEPTGKLGVVLARNYQKGKIVIVGDQNMFSDTFLNYADNYKLWLNSFAWLLDDNALRDPLPYQKWKPESLWAVEAFERPEFGSDDEHGMYHLFALLNRHYPAFASNEKPADCKLALLGDGNASMSEETVAELVKHLRSGKNVLALHSDQSVLENEGSVIRVITDKLDLKNPKFEEKDEQLVLKVPDGGAIRLFGSSELYSNRTIPAPTVKPSDEEQKVIQKFLQAVKTAAEN